MNNQISNQIESKDENLIVHPKKSKRSSVLLNSLCAIVISILAVSIMVSNAYKHEINSEPSQYIGATTIALTKNNLQAREGSVTIQDNENGLVIRGTINGKKPKFPSKK